MRILTLILVVFVVNSCAYPVIPASRIGHTPEEHAKLKKQARKLCAEYPPPGFQ